LDSLHLPLHNWPMTQYVHFSSDFSYTPLQKIQFDSFQMALQFPLNAATNEYRWKTCERSVQFLPVHLIHGYPPYENMSVQILDKHHQIPSFLQSSDLIF